MSKPPVELRRIEHVTTPLTPAEKGQVIKAASRAGVPVAVFTRQLYAAAIKDFGK